MCRTSPSRYSPARPAPARRTRRRVRPPSAAVCGRVARCRCCTRGSRAARAGGLTARRGRRRHVVTCTKSRRWRPSSKTARGPPRASADRKNEATPAYGVSRRHPRPVHVVVAQRHRRPARGPAPRPPPGSWRAFARVHVARIRGASSPTRPVSGRRTAGSGLEAAAARSASGRGPGRTPRERALVPPLPVHDHRPGEHQPPTPAEAIAASSTAVPRSLRQT